MLNGKFTKFSPWARSVVRKMPLGQRVGDKSDSRYCGFDTEFDDDMHHVLAFNVSGGFDFIVGLTGGISYPKKMAAFVLLFKSAGFFLFGRRKPKMSQAALVLGSGGSCATLRMAKHNAPTMGNDAQARVSLGFGADRKESLWRCALGCGACCKLHKGPSFASSEEIFHDPSHFQLYRSLISPDGWCMHFEKTTQTCSIYSEPNIVKKLQVDRGAIKFVLASANIMCPGLTSPVVDEYVRYPAEIKDEKGFLGASCSKKSKDADVGESKVPEIKVVAIAAD